MLSDRSAGYKGLEETWSGTSSHLEGDSDFVSAKVNISLVFTSRLP